MSDSCCIAGHFPELPRTPAPLGIRLDSPAKPPAFKPRPIGNRYVRKYRAVEIGDVFGAWTVIDLLGRGYMGRSEVRVRLRCKCGVSKDAFEYAVRKSGNRCTHKGPSRAERGRLGGLATARK